MTHGLSAVHALDGGGVTKSKKLVASFYDIYLLGITIVVAGQLCVWNTGLQIGFWEYFIGLILTSIGHICLTFCLAEMASFLSFAGGSYGYVRCTMGSTMGYLAGFFESVEYTLYHAIAVAQFADLFPAMTGIDKAYSPIIWLVFYSIALPFSIQGGSNLPKYATGMVGGGMDFMKYYSSTLWFYVGVEALTLTCDEIKDASKHVPKAIVALVFTMFATGILVFFITSSVSPGPSDLVNEWSPLNPGLRSIFQCSNMVLSYLAMPGSFATGFGFMYAYGHQLHSMSKSGLFPKFLSGTYGDYATPHRSLLSGSLFSFLLLLIVFHTVADYQKMIFNMCMLSSCWVYIALARAYMICYDRYSNLERDFRSPLGKWGAYCVVIVYSLMIVGLAFFQDDNYESLIFQGREFFSQEEQKKFMKAYVVNANHKRKRKSSKTSSIFSQATRLLAGIRVQPSLANREKVPSSVGIANHLSPEHEKNSMIMDTSPPLPLQLSRVGLDPRENMMVPILGKCNSSEQAMGGVPRLRVDTVDMLESEVRYPSSTTQQLSRRS
eukprot:scaffold334_cov173-Ochromonas_danica.AAC.12